MESAEQSANAVARLALITGVTVSFAFLIAGLAMQYVAKGWGVDPSLLLRIGIAMLLGTPVIRVAVLAVGFVRERRTTFALVTFCILLLLGASVVIGLR
jgi:uncharacterized membrane protein